MMSKTKVKQHLFVENIYLKILSRNLFNIIQEIVANHPMLACYMLFILVHKDRTLISSNTKVKLSLMYTELYLQMLSRNWFIIICKIIIADIPYKLINWTNRR